MDKEVNSLTLARFYFGESAGRLQSGVSERLVAWSKAFEEWVEERKKINKNAEIMCQLAWERLGRQRGKMPWEITPEDIREHMQWMVDKGYKKGTINGEVGLMAEFYKWCAAKGVDKDCGEAFNPTRGVKRLRRERFEGVSTWSREEFRQLLELAGRDETVLGKREKAFFLLRLNSGVPLKQISNLKWEQIEERGEDAWVRWSERYEPCKLPREVWVAMKDYLRASGRLDGMEKGKVIFAPLKYPYMEERGSKADDWAEERPMTQSAKIKGLRVYGRRLGIDKDKLNMHALRRTALRLKMEEGESVAGMRQFMDSQEDRRFTAHRLRKVPPMAVDDGGMRVRASVPPRQAKRYKEGDQVKHGMFRRNQDKLAVRQMMEEDTGTVEEEIRCLRMLMKGLVERGTNDEESIEAYTMSACRLGELMAFRKTVKKAEKDRCEDWLRKLDEWHEKDSRCPSSKEVIAAANRHQAGGDVREEVATLKVILRNVYQQSEVCKEKHGYVRLVNLYGKGCVRLVRLMMLEKDEMSKVGKYIDDSIDRAIREVRRRWGLER